MMPPHVLVIGRSCVDHIAVVDRYPDENTKTAIRMALKEGGGQGATAACCIRRLGGGKRAATHEPRGLKAYQT